jgi:predicted amidophosphoribosyltransferase
MKAGVATPLPEPAKQVLQQVLTGKFCSGCGAAAVDVENAFCAQCGAKL